VGFPSLSIYPNLAQRYRVFFRADLIQRITVPTTTAAATRVSRELMRATVEKFILIQEGESDKEARTICDENKDVRILGRTTVHTELISSST